MRRFDSPCQLQKLAGLLAALASTKVKQRSEGVVEQSSGQFCFARLYHWCAAIMNLENCTDITLPEKAIHSRYAVHPAFRSVASCYICGSNINKIFAN
jgi:hypothetical protein